jgi:hypothetical protein
MTLSALVGLLTGCKLLLQLTVTPATLSSDDLADMTLQLRFVNDGNEPVAVYPRRPGTRRPGTVRRSSRSQGRSYDNRRATERDSQFFA